MARKWGEWKRPIVYFCSLIIVFFLLRIPKLTDLPIFTDEAIYIRWAQIGGSDAAWRFISMTDGKQPLFTWLVMASLRIFHDPLVTGRMVSVMAGLTSMVGLFLLGAELFKKKSVGLIATCLYVLSPFAFVYDRMALYDSLVATFFIWNLYLSVLLTRYMRLDFALILGLTLGVGMLNKTSAFLSLYLLPTTLFIFDWKSRYLAKRMALWIGLCIVSAILSQTVYGILRLSPFFYIISQKDTLFVYPFSEWVRHPLEFFYGNFHGLFNWLMTYVTWPIFTAAVISVACRKKYFFESVVCLMFFLAPFIALSLFGRILYPRFIFFMAMPLLLLAAYVMDNIMSVLKKKIVAWLVISLLCLPSVYLTARIFLDIKTAPLAKGDVGQLISDWPSGWGTKEVIMFLNRESQKGKVAVYTEGTFGLFPYALEIYLGENKNVEIHGLWPLQREMPDDVRLSVQDKPTYFVSNFTQEKPLWPIELVATYQKGNNPSVAMRLYKVMTSYESR